MPRLQTIVLRGAQEGRGPRMPCAQARRLDRGRVPPVRGVVSTLRQHRRGGQRTHGSRMPVKGPPAANPAMAMFRAWVLQAFQSPTHLPALHEEPLHGPQARVQSHVQTAQGPRPSGGGGGGVVVLVVVLEVRRPMSEPPRCVCSCCGDGDVSGPVEALRESMGCLAMPSDCNRSAVQLQTSSPCSVELRSGSQHAPRIERAFLRRSPATEFTWVACLFSPALSAMSRCSQYRYGIAVV
eukprot:Amastigsp_a340502_211.p1 type:complete len:239 gc:universal Amastigsp_a340502_211:1364-648(-)